MGSVLTKNRYQDEAGFQGYFHQFGIGPSGSAGIGYSLRPLRDGAASLDIQLLYHHLHTRVEVQGVGDDRWRSGLLQLVLSTGF